MENLEPNTGELTVELLMYISTQLNNASMPAYAPQPFAAEQPYVVANALFFASLAILLVTSLLAILVKGWVRDFNHNLPPYKLAAKRAKEREYRFRGLIAYKMPEIVASLPILTQLALILFCIGLLIYLNQTDVHIMVATGCILALGLAFYLLTTIIALYDSSAPFPSPLSRFLSHITRWMTRFPSRMIRWIKHRRSICTYYSFHISLASLPRKLLAVLRKGRQAVIQSRNSRKSSDLELHVINRVANDTLVARENVGIFTALVQCLAAHSRLRPVARQEWREIISAILIVDKETPLLTIQGILRVIVIAYDPTTDGSGTLLNLASALLEIDEEREPVPIPLPTDPKKQEIMRRTPHLVPLSAIASTKAAASVLGREHGEKESENIRLVPLSPLQPLIQRLKNIIFSNQDWPTIIEKQGKLEEITRELLWVEDFFQSHLYYALNEELQSKILESGIQSTRDMLVLASWLPTELALPLVSAGIRIGMALDGPKRRKDEKEEYFSAAHCPSIDPEAIYSDLLSFLDLSGHASTLCVPVMLALWHLDPLSSLLSVHRRKGELDLIANLLGVEPIALSHFSLLKFAINSTPRKKIQGTFMMFIEFWDQFAKDPVVPLETEHLQFFEMALKRLQSVEGSSNDPPLAREDRDFALGRSAIVQNPWIVLAGHPIRRDEAEISNVEHVAASMEQTPWVGDERYERIVRDNLELYCTTLRKPYLPILVLFEQSAELQSYLRALCLSSHTRGVAKNLPRGKSLLTETRVARFTTIASRIFKEERDPPKVLENYLVTFTELFTFYVLLLPEVQKMIATVFQQQEGLQWLSDACKLLAIEVQNGGLIDSDGTLVKVPPDQLSRLHTVVRDTYLFLEDLIPQFTSQLTSMDVSALQALLNLPGYFITPEKREELVALAMKAPGWTILNT